MTANIDDTDLDALAAQVRTHPQLDDAEKASLFGAARAGSDKHAQEKLVGHYLREALAASLQQRNRGLDLADLYQEANVAIVAVIAELVAGDGGIDDLDAKVSTAIAAELDSALEQFSQIKKTEEQLVHDTNLLLALRIRLKEEKRTEPSPEELAGLLEWPLARVEMVLEALVKAQATHDVELLEYLDDE